MRVVTCMLAWLLAPQDLPGLRGPGEVLAAVTARGSVAVAHELWSDDGAHRAFLRGVSAADREWLRAAMAVRPGTDAHASEELDEALARALLASPAAALPVVRELWWRDVDPTVCEFDWDSELPGSVSQYVTQLEAALHRDPLLTPELRRACEQGIAKTRDRVRKHGS